MEDAPKRAAMPEGAAPILEYRSLEKDYATLLPLIKPGMRVLDVGCGPGAISKGIAKLVGSNGSVVGIDNSEHLIARGKHLNQAVKNLELRFEDLFDHQPATKYDLIVSARVLQWLNNPQAALVKIMSMLRAGGQVSILDYNHNALELVPNPPKEMLHLYAAFLRWRSDAGMNNQIAEDLPAYFKAVGFDAIEVIEANETYRKGEANFLPKIGIWTAVAASRGKQLVKAGYLSESQRLQAIKTYEEWIVAESQMMVMKLKDVRGVKPM